MNLAAVRLLANDLMCQHGVGDWTFRFDHAKRRAGACHHSKFQITLSKPLMALWDEADVRDTILHEIAHALVGHSAGHGPAWQAMAASIGAKPDRCYSGEQPRVDAPWIGTCPNGHEAHRFRAPKPGRRVSCAKCSPKFDVRFEVTWRRNPNRKATR